MNDQEDIQVIIDVIQDIKDRVDTNLNESINLNNNKYLNDKINEKFMKMLDEDEDDGSSSDSSSSTLTSSSDDEQVENKKLKKSTGSKFSKKIEEDEDDDDDEENSNLKQLNNQKYLKTKDEVTIDDLGPIEKLNINCEDDVKLLKLGQVASIVDDKLVIIQSLIVNKDQNSKENCNQAPPLDEGTILFDSNRKSIGKIFEIFGPVANPFYSIRFNTSKEIKENNLDLEISSLVYFAPQSEKYTKYIFNVDELRKIKGSDASWNNDNEPPVECLEYSDDEQEKQAKKQLKLAKKKNNHNKNDQDSSTEEGEDLDSVSIISTSSGSTNNNNNRFNYKRNYNNQIKKSTSNFEGFNKKNYNNNHNRNLSNNQSLPKSQSNNSNQFNQSQQYPPVQYQNFYQNPYMNWQNGVLPPHPSMMPMAAPNYPFQYPQHYLHPNMYQQPPHFNPYFINPQQQPYSNQYNPQVQQPTTSNKSKMDKGEMIKSLNYDVLDLDKIDQNPYCPHGPTILFSNGKKKFFSCSACRDNKKCSFYYGFDQTKKIPDYKIQFWNERYKEENERISVENSYKIDLIKKMNKNQRIFCQTCNTFLLNKIEEHSRNHSLMKNITDDMLNHPLIEILKPIESNSSNAQFLFDENTIKLVMNLINNLHIDSVLCIGTPSVFEKLNEKNHKIKRFLLDIDSRFSQFYEKNLFLRFNMFNNHFFTENSNYLNFLADSKKLFVVIDPPYGALNHDRIFIILFYPYFNETWVKKWLPDFNMLDYKVTYENQKNFSNKTRYKKGSTARIFTNISLSQIKLDEEEGYKYCNICEKYTYNENIHCHECKKCTSKDGGSYKHCKICKRCVKDSYNHCDKCETCHLGECNKKALKRKRKSS